MQTDVTVSPSSRSFSSILIKPYKQPKNERDEGETVTLVCMIYRSLIIKNLILLN